MHLRTSSCFKWETWKKKISIYCESLSSFYMTRLEESLSVPSATTTAPRPPHVQSPGGSSVERLNGQVILFAWR